MKVKFIVAVFTALFSFSGLYANIDDHSKMYVVEKADIIEVTGKCGMCKSRS